MNEHDREMLVWLRVKPSLRALEFKLHPQASSLTLILRVVALAQAFQKCDLYSKVDEVIDVDKLKGYYLKAIAKYFPKTLKW